MCENTELVRRAAHVLTSRGGRDCLDNIGYRSGTPIVVVAAGERLGGVFQRVCVANASMVLLAVWFPSRRRFLLLHVGRNQFAMVCDMLEKAGSVYRPTSVCSRMP